MELVIPLRSHDEERLVLGPYDRHAKWLRESLDVRVISRAGALRLSGDEATLEPLRERIDQVLARARRGVLLDAAEVERILRGPAVPSKEDGEGRAAEKRAAATRLSAIVHPRSPGQKRYLDAIRETTVTFAIGPAGTGKTFLAVAMAVEALKRGEFRRLVLTRPAVEAGEKLGFLPGDYQAKVHPYLRPLYDALNDLLDPQASQRYFDNDVLEVAPLAFMRGRTLNSSFIILDEAQNTTRSQMMMFLTRMGYGSKIVVTGDVTQVDLPRGVGSGLIDVQRRLRGVEGISFVDLQKEDIVRHPLVQRIVQAYEHDAKEATEASTEGSVVEGP